MKLLERVLESLETLKMTTAKEALPDLLAQATANGTDPVEALDAALSAEVGAQRERRIQRRFRESKLPEVKTYDQYEWNFQPELDRNQMMGLARLDFVRDKLNVIFSGKSGTGKSHLAAALAYLACGQELSVLYTTCADMLTKLYSGLADNSLDRRLRRYTNPTLLLIDDLGTEKVEIVHNQGAALFFKVINKRYGKASTIITSNLDQDAWGTYFGDPNVTVAALDRFTEHAIPVRIPGESYRAERMKRRLAVDTAKKGKPKKPK
jgi:DNA replication protein DnaC